NTAHNDFLRNGRRSICPGAGRVGGSVCCGLSLPRQRRGGNEVRWGDGGEARLRKVVDRCPFPGYERRRVPCPRLCVGMPVKHAHAKPWAWHPATGLMSVRRRHRYTQWKSPKETSLARKSSISARSRAIRSCRLRL